MQEPHRDPRLPGDPDVDRMWIVRAAEFVAQRRFALVLLVIGGGILFAAVSRTISAYSNPGEVISFQEKMVTRFSVTGSSRSGTTSYNGSSTSPQALSAFVMVGAALTCVGALWAAKQFSLRWLLIAVFVIGALGALPIRIPAHRGGLANFSIEIQQRLTDWQLASIKASLQPSAALATLPSEFRKKLSTLENAGVLSVDVLLCKFGETPNGVCCVIELHGDLDDTERQALLDFYEYYVSYLALCAAESYGTNKLLPKSNEYTGKKIWEPWRKQWVAARNAENKKLNVEDPKK